MLHPDSGFFLILQVNTRETYREGGNISLKKMQHAFCRLVLPDVRRFWATFPRHGCEKEVCHKYSSSSYVRGMSNPITYITRIHLATERSRRMKKREKQKLARYKIYSAP
jgi:hypothetical protein